MSLRDVAFPWWPEHCIYPAQEPPGSSERVGPDREGFLPSVAPAGEAHVLWVGNGVPDDTYDLKTSHNVSYKKDAIKERKRRKTIQWLQHNWTRRDVRPEYVPSSLLRRLVKEDSRQMHTLKSFHRFPGNTQSTAVAASTAENILFSPSGSAAVLARAKITCDPFPVEDDPDASRFAATGKFPLYAKKVNELTEEEEEHAHVTVYGPRQNAEKAASNRIRADERILGLQAADEENGNLFAVSWSAFHARLFKWERSWNRAKQIATIPSARACISGVVINEWLPGELFLLLWDGSSKIVRLRESGSITESQVLNNPFAKSESDRMQPVWRAAVNSQHPRRFLLADEQSVIRMDLGSGLCQPILRILDWKLSNSKQYLKAISRQRNQPHCFVVATDHHVCVLEERYPKVPVVSWMLPTFSSGTRFLATETLGGFHMVQTLAVEMNPRASSMAYHAEQTTSSTDPFATPFRSSGPPLSHYSVPMRPNGLALAKLSNEAALVLYSDVYGSVFAQGVSTDMRRHRRYDKAETKNMAFAEDNVHSLEHEISNNPVLQEALNTRAGQGTELRPSTGYLGNVPAENYLLLARTEAECELYKKEASATGAILSGQDAPRLFSELCSDPQEVSTVDVDDAEFIEKHGKVYHSREVEQRMLHVFNPASADSNALAINKFWASQGTTPTDLS